MNNNLISVLIAWETRSRQSDKVAVSLCKDYGLRQLLKNVFSGNIYEREKEIILKKIHFNFSKKKDKFCLIILCKSCFHSSLFEEKVKKSIQNNKTFEIICPEEYEENPINEAPA